VIDPPEIVGYRQQCFSAGVVELWTFASRFQDALELHSVPSIAEMEQAFINPDQPKSATTAVLVSLLHSARSWMFLDVFCVLAP